MDTNKDYSPWSLLPAPEPRTVSPPINYFYENVAKHLIKDTVRIMANGLGIDLDKIEEMEQTIDKVIDDVEARLIANPIVQKFLQQKHKKLVQKKQAHILNKKREPDYYYKPFKYSDMTHRSYFMHVYAQKQSMAQPNELLPTGVPKWPANLVKKFSKSNPLLEKLLSGTLTESHTLVKEAMQLLAQHKCDIYNRSIDQELEEASVDLPKLNSRSPDDKHHILTTALGYESGKLTDAYEKFERQFEQAIRYGNPEPTEPKNKWSWGRKQLEFIAPSLTDPDEIDLFDCLIEFSFGDKIKTSFIPAFYKYTINGRLYSNLKVLGAKSGRFTSSNPNMLQLPSTGSIYAKPVKKCFVAPPGKLILTADFNALEDRVLASITLDEGKCALLEDKTLDGHCYNALGYYGDKVEQHLDLTSDPDYKDKVRQFNSLVEKKHAALKDLRQDSKAVTFKLAYGGVSDSHKGGAITPEIYDNYHNKLYPGVRNYIDSYVVPTTKSNKKIHLGLGFHINSENADKDVRTLHNATIQFWSILSILSINEMHSRIDSAGLQDQVKVISSIYDSIYLEVTNSPEIIQ